MKKRPIQYSYVTLNSYLMLFDTQHWNVFQMLGTYTRAMGRFLDVMVYLNFLARGVSENGKITLCHPEPPALLI